MSDKVKIVTILAMAACFLASPFLFPGNVGIQERLMYGFFAICGLGAVPIVASGIRVLRGKQ